MQCLPENHLPLEVECSIDNYNGVGVEIPAVLSCGVHNDRFLQLWILRWFSTPGHQHVVYSAPTCISVDDPMVGSQDEIEQLCNGAT